MQFSNKDIQLFNEAGINVENKNYTNDEVERFKIKVTDFIMSQSTKDIEKYSTRFITSEFENSESDIAYRKKGTSIFFLIEHQSKVDYSMPYRILTYNMEIMKSALRENLLNTKGYKLPIVYPMVLYTGKKKWSAKKYLEQCQEHLEECDVKTFTYYHLIDINQCKEQELLEENNFLSKILLLEKMKTTDKLEENLQKIMKSNLSKKERQMLSRLVIKTEWMV